MGGRCHPKSRRQNCSPNEQAAQPPPAPANLAVQAQGRAERRVPGLVAQRGGRRGRGSLQYDPEPPSSLWSHGTHSHVLGPGPPRPPSHGGLLPGSFLSRSEGGGQSQACVTAALLPGVLAPLPLHWGSGQELEFSRRLRVPALLFIGLIQQASGCHLFSFFHGGMRSFSNPAVLDSPSEGMSLPRPVL